jgi:Peptidase S46
VKDQGFQVPLQQLWDSKKKTGLLNNALQLQGCSASFVSPNGLLITNHHCLVGILQQHSTPQRNLFEAGYLAKTAADELPAQAFRLLIPKDFEDVTAKVLAAVPAGAKDLERFKAVEAKQKELLAACETTQGLRCTFAAYDGGSSFFLFTATELTDVRLVWAPPLAVGEYGGEIDNWNWPRHTGDFAFARAYGKDGKPWKPEHWFGVSTEGVKPGDAIAILGYPGTTWRGLLADEMAERVERWFPAVESWTGEVIALYEAASKADAAAKVALADDLKSLENRHKNARGQQAGFKRGRLLEVQLSRETVALTNAMKTPAQAGAVDARKELLALHQQKLASWDRDFLLDALSGFPKALAWSVHLARRSTEGAKPDADREPGYQERDLSRLRERFERDLKRYDPATDQLVAAAWLKRAAALPAGQKLAPLKDVTSAKLKNLYQSKLFDFAERKRMFEESPAQLAARKDPLIDLGFALDVERRALKDRRDAWAGASYRLRPVWHAAMQAVWKGPMAPDANSTLRVTFGRVKGYSPRDAVTHEPQTTLSGMVAKHTGADPFVAPAPLLEAARAGRVGRWKDASLNDVPVNFLSDADTTGGNSGSPTIDAKGRLVGVNFDRIWENVANDFGYDPKIARNVNADVRYALWMLEEIEKADGLLQELGVVKPVR